ncbi:MAG: FAD-binding oxidoreductase, partial [Cypionkella sp.]
MTDLGAAGRADGMWQAARLVQISTLTPRIKSLVLALQRPFTFRAGQHVDLRLTAPDGYQARRSYSIASAPSSSGLIELAIERLDDGEVSPFFHDVAAVGDSIELRGPLGGHFVWGPEDGGPLLLIGGGSGVVPLMAMLRHRRDAQADVPSVLLLSSRTLAETLYRDELLAMEAAAPGFTLRLAVTRGAPERPVDYGRRLDLAMLKAV